MSKTMKGGTVKKKKKKKRKRKNCSKIETNREKKFPTLVHIITNLDTSLSFPLIKRKKERKMRDQKSFSSIWLLH